jgi:transposase
MPSRSLSTADLTACRIAYERDGATYRELASRYGCAPSTVMALLRAAGVVPRPRGQAKAPRKASVVQVDWAESDRQQQLDEDVRRATLRQIAVWNGQRAARRWV